MTPGDFLPKAIQAAKDAGHIWPEYAACEAALESGWGESQLAKRANNLFGQKQGFLTTGSAWIELPTKEYIEGAWLPCMAKWPKFDSWTDSFKSRMQLLQSKTSYGYAMKATTGESFIREVSKVWATDPERANKVLEIYSHHVPTQ